MQCNASGFQGASWEWLYVCGAVAEEAARLERQWRSRGVKRCTCKRSQAATIVALPHAARCETSRGRSHCGQLTLEMARAALAWRGKRGTRA